MEVLMRLARQLLLLLLFCVPLAAHELGAMHVMVTFNQGARWQADIVLDLEHVPLAQRPGDVASAEVRTAWCQAFLSACAPAFDGRPATVDSAIYQGTK